ncbi:MAG TPA: ABC transporter substrate-binding protein [Stellaceae bacterium]|nr:ABC transporter substrate-binding protein [Stellaceae bacterium]
MRRRDFAAMLGAAAVAWPVTPRAQATIPIIGFLNGRTADEWADNTSNFRLGLRDTGFEEGRNVAIEYRWAGGRYEKLPDLATELLQHRLSAIVACGGENSITAAKAATQTIPIVAVFAGDPVLSGFVTSLNRPNGNITGIAQFGVRLAAKRLELLHEMVPAAAKLAYLDDPNNSALAQSSAAVEQAARARGLSFRAIYCNTVADIERSLAFREGERPDLMLVSGFPTFVVPVVRDKIIEIAAKRALPVGFSTEEQTRAGGLTSYAPNIGGVYRQVGNYAGRILKGEKPADLPVQQPTKFNLVINLKTAKALGITVPPMLLATADEVIE